MSASNVSGPTAGTIFVGHLKSFSGMNGATMNPSLNSNIALKSATLVEGIHIVPKNISPPGFDLEGQTSPDIHVRPFNLVISARNIDRPNANELVQILSLTITGGCQWIPILPPFNQIAIDYLQFDGDFEVITVILHGIKLDINVLSAEAQRVVQNGYSNSKLPPQITDDLPEEEEGIDIDITTTSSAAVKIPRSVLLALSAHLDSYSHKPQDKNKKLCSTAPENILQQLSSCDSSKGSCVVAVETVAELVGAIFSLEDDNTCSDPSFAVRTKAINNLVNIMQQCLKSATSNKVKNMSTHEHFSVALGEEAVGVLAGILLKLLDCVRADSNELTPDGGGCGQCDPASPDEFRDLCSAVLKCCNILMTNEFSASAFADVGGLSLLSYIARQSPQLPPLLQAQLISCFCGALRHAELLPRLVEPPEIYTDATGSYASEISVYQTLVLTMGNMRESAPAAKYCKEALHWSALAEACSSLSMFSESLPAALTVIAEAASHRVATSHKTPGENEREVENQMDEEGGEGYSNGKAQDCEMSRACSLLHTLALTSDALVRAWQSALTMHIMSDKEKATNTPTGRCDLSLYELLQKTSILSSLAALTALSQTANELSSLCDWNTSLRNHMASDADTCYYAVASIVATLLRLEGGLGCLLLASNTSAVQLIWLYFSQEDSAMSSQSLDELLLLSGGPSCISDGFLSFHPSSVGWILWLSAYATGLADQIVAAVSTLVALSVVAEGLESPAKRLLVKAQEKQRVEAEAVLSEAVEGLNATAYNVVGSSVVVRVVSDFCFRELLKVADISTGSTFGSSSSVLSSAARLVLLSALSGTRTLRGELSMSFREVVQTLAIAIVDSSTVSLSNLEESIAAAAYSSGKAAKSNDPRHKSVKVEVVRGYTDDTKVLAEKVIAQSISTKVIQKEGEEKIESDSSVKSIRHEPSKLIARWKTSIKDFTQPNKQKRETTDRIHGQGGLRHGCFPQLPCLTFSANMLSSSLHSTGACLPSKGQLAGETLDMDPSLSIAYDGELLHNLLNSIELASWCLRDSNLFKIRYSSPCSASLDAVILVHLVKCTPVDSLLELLNTKKVTKVQVEEPTNGSIDVAVANVSSYGLQDGQEGNAEMIEMMSEAEVCLNALEACMRLLLKILEISEMYSSQKSKKVKFIDLKEESSNLSHSDSFRKRVLDIVIEGRAVALDVLGESIAGALGSSVRAICAVSTSILFLHCPRPCHCDVLDSKASVSSSNRGLVAYISKTAIYRPSALASNISLLIELLPNASSSSSSSSYSNSLEADLAMIYEKANTLNFDVNAKGQESGNIKELRVQRNVDSIAFYSQWEQFLWEKPSATAAVIDRDEAREKEREEDLFRGSGSLIVPEDPLYKDLCPSGHAEKQGSRITILSLILFAIGSTSFDLHRLAAVLCAKSMCLGPHSAATIARAIVHTIQRRVALQDPSALEEEEAGNFAPELSLARLLVLVEGLCCIDTICVAFLQEGLLLPVLRALRGSSDRNVCMLATQLLMSVYRSLLRMTSGLLNKTADKANIEKEKGKGHRDVRECLLWVLSALSDALSAALPLAMVSFQDVPNGVLLWEQAVLTMSLLPSSSVKRIIETISRTFTIEGLAVKLWLAFEDSYQQLFELTELRKLCLAHPEEASLQDLAGEDCAQGALQAAHMLFTGAACALEAVIDFALMAFLEGTIALPTLARCGRCSLSDPKRVVLRYQRAYTMWAVQAQQTESTGGSEGSRREKRSAVYSPFVSGSVTDPQHSSVFDARHELISSALRNTVEITGRVAKLVSGREVRPKGGTGILKSIQGDDETESDSTVNISMDFDFNSPFTDLGLPGEEALSLWFRQTPPAVRLPRLAELRSGSTVDTLHTVLRRGLLYGDDTEDCLFGSTVVAHMDGIRDVLSSKRSKRKAALAAINTDRETPKIPPPPPPQMPMKPPVRPSMAPPSGPGPTLPAALLPFRPPQIAPPPPLQPQQRPPPQFQQPPAFGGVLPPPPPPPSMRKPLLQQKPPTQQGW